MRSRVLTEARAVTGGWIGRAFGSDGVIAIGAAPSEQQFVEALRANVQDYLAVYGSAWISQMQHGGDSAIPNCPEGAIQLPIDSWMCKVVGAACPIQAQVFTNDPDAFLAGCIAPESRKRDILRVVTEGHYSGFHHAAGRYLCVRCEDEHGSESSFSYHYPWELAALEDFAPFDVVRDMRSVMIRLRKAGIGQTAVANALCAPHALELAQVLYPNVAQDLRVLEFDVRRPA